MKVRTEKIFNKLLFSQYSIPIDELANENEVSIRTIRNDITEINTFLKHNSFCLIENIRNVGIWLDTSEEDIKEISNLLESEQESIYLNKNMRLFNLMLEITIGSNFFVYEKEREFSVSKSTLDSDMRDIRAIFKSYNLELISDSKRGIELVGSERTIRTMIFDQIFENLGTMDVLDTTKHTLPEFQVLFEFIPLKTIYKINNLYNELFLKLNDYIYKEQSIIFMEIWIFRNRRNNRLDNKNDNFKIDAGNELILFIKNIISVFNLKTNDKEIKYIYFMLNTLLNKEETNPVDWINAQVFTIRLINHVEDKLSISFVEETEILYERLLEHNLNLYSRIKNNIQIYNPLTDDIHKSYTQLFKIIEEFSIDNLVLSNNKIKDDEIAFLVIHFLTAVSKKKQSEGSIYRAAVFCNYGLATGNLLAENLKQYFPIDVIAVLSINDVNLLDKLEVDIAFSTSSIDIKSVPYLVIDPIINNENRKKVEYFLNKNIQYKKTIITNHNIAYNEVFTTIIKNIESAYGEVDPELINKIIDSFDKNGLNINRKEIQPMIEDILLDDAILLDLNVNNWEEAISGVSEPLLHKNIIEDSYVDAMIDSVKEHGPYIVIGEHLALAHARPEDGVNELGLSVATLNPPIKFGNEATDPVEIIFCLAAVDSYSHLNIIKSLVNLLNDNSKLLDLKNITSKTDFKDKLFKY